MNYEEPNKEDLARLAAEAMGSEYKLCAYHLFKNPNPALRWLGEIVSSNFAPEDCHNDAQILVEEALKLGLEKHYLIELGCGEYRRGNFHCNAIYYMTKTPEQKTRAFLKSIHESKQ